MIQGRGGFSSVVSIVLSVFLSTAVEFSVVAGPVIFSYGELYHFNYHSIVHVIESSSVVLLTQIYPSNPMGRGAGNVRVTRHLDRTLRFFISCHR